MRSVSSNCKRAGRRLRLILSTHCLAAAFLLGLLAGCSSPAKLTPQEAAAATEITNEMNTPSAAIGSSRYRTYRWLTPEEMTVHQLGYDLSMDPQTRQEVEEAVNDQLARFGYQQADPADFTVAFTDVYLDQNPMLGNTDIEIIKYPEEKFTVAFFDAQTGSMLWRGWGKEVLRGDHQTDEQVVLAVSHALENMPVPLIEP
jgi:hypothetical protein